MERIDGSTRLFGIIGDPIGAVRSPEVFNAMFMRQDVNAVMVPLHVGTADLRAVWTGLKAMRNLEGVVITMPHKTPAATLVDRLGRTATLIGSINAARREPDGRWQGDTFDGHGCVEGLRMRGHEVAGKGVFLLGVGGAGAAIAVALAEAGVARLVVQDTDAEKRDRILSRLTVAFPDVVLASGAIEDNAHVDVAINATPLGMKEDDPLPFDPALLDRSTLVVDIITKSTPLLERAALTGHRTHGGQHMHHGQAIGVARFFGFDLDAR
ncbi:MAG: shikimate dehydrogenase [Burkholderiales bacterium]|nr:shikimate dehydrogenase [Burkholderiales bacterium]